MITPEMYEGQRVWNSILDSQKRLKHGVEEIFSFVNVNNLLDGTK